MTTLETKSLKLFVNFLYEEVLEDFLLKERNSSIISFINWKKIIQNIKEGRNLLFIIILNQFFLISILDASDQIDSATEYKCFISYTLNLFSNFMITSDIDFLIEIHGLMHKTSSIPESMKDKFKLICSKMVCNSLSLSLSVFLN